MAKIPKLGGSSRVSAQPVAMPTQNISNAGMVHKAKGQFAKQATDFIVGLEKKRAEAENNSYANSKISELVRREANYAEATKLKMSGTNHDGYAGENNKAGMGYLQEAINEAPSGTARDMLQAKADSYLTNKYSRDTAFENKERSKYHVNVRNDTKEKNLVHVGETGTLESTKTLFDEEAIDAAQSYRNRMTPAQFEADKKLQHELPETLLKRWLSMEGGSGIQAGTDFLHNNDGDYRYKELRDALGGERIANYKKIFNNYRNSANTELKKLNYLVADNLGAELETVRTQGFTAQKRVKQQGMAAYNFISSLPGSATSTVKMLSIKEDIAREHWIQSLANVPDNLLMAAQYPTSGNILIGQKTKQNMAMFEKFKNELLENRRNDRISAEAQYNQNIHKQEGTHAILAKTGRVFGKPLEKTITDSFDGKTPQQKEELLFGNNGYMNQYPALPEGLRHAAADNNKNMSLYMASVTQNKLARGAHLADKTELQEAWKGKYPDDDIKSIRKDASAYLYDQGFDADVNFAPRQNALLDGVENRIMQLMSGTSPLSQARATEVAYDQVIADEFHYIDNGHTKQLIPKAHIKGDIKQRDMQAYVEYLQDPRNKASVMATMYDWFRPFDNKFTKYGGKDGKELVTMSPDEMYDTLFGDPNRSKVQLKLNKSGDGFHIAYSVGDGKAFSKLHKLTNRDRMESFKAAPIFEDQVIPISELRTFGSPYSAWISQQIEKTKLQRKRDVEAIREQEIEFGESAF